MDILSIGNSFSQDAQRYLHRIAKADGFGLNTYNLYIGGCPLSLHYENMLNGEETYILEMNGQSTGFKASLKEALLNRNWDVVTLQQVSNKAPYYESYEPYLNEIAEYVRFCVPEAKIAIHQTWAYEENSHRLNVELGYSSHKDMFKDIEKAYKKAAEAIAADFVIPSGEVFERLIASGVKKVHRDTFHAGYGAGRYALGLLWYRVLSGNNIKDNSFSDFDEEISEEEIKAIKQCVMECCKLCDC